MCVLSIKYYLAYLIVSILFSPLIVQASNFIALTETEKRLVDHGDIVIREIGKAGDDGRTIEAVGLINAPRKVILDVLTDYKNYPEFMPNVSHIEIIEQNTNDSVLNYTLTLPLGKIKKYRLGLTVTKGGSQSSMIHWQLQQWPGLKAEETIKDTNGYWLIKDAANSSSYVLYHVYTDPGPIPFGLGWIVDILSKNSIPEALLNTKLRAEKLKD